jgi:hypothetical protein
MSEMTELPATPDPFYKVDAPRGKLEFFSYDQMREYARACIAADRAKRAEWIPVSARLPEKDVEVIVWPYPTEYIRTGKVFNKFWSYSEFDMNHDDEHSMDPPAYWTPLPPPPKEPA